MKQDLEGSTNQSIAGAEKENGHPFRATISGNTGTHTELWTQGPEKDSSLYYRIAIQIAYRIFEAKYHSRPLALNEIHKEAGQIREIQSLDAVQLGFVSVNGFEKQEDGYTYYTGEDLYR